MKKYKITLIAVVAAVLVAVLVAAITFTYIPAVMPATTYAGPGVAMPVSISTVAQTLSGLEEGPDKQYFAAEQTTETLKATADVSNDVHVEGYAWSCSWQGSNEWLTAGEKNVGEYVTVTPTPGDNSEAQVKRLQYFGCPVKVTVTVTTNYGQTVGECVLDSGEKISALTTSSNGLLKAGTDLLTCEYAELDYSKRGEKFTLALNTPSVYTVAASDEFHVEATLQINREQYEIFKRDMPGFTNVDWSGFSSTRQDDKLSSGILATLSSDRQAELWATWAKRPDSGLFEISVKVYSGMDSEIFSSVIPVHLYNYTAVTVTPEHVVF